MRQFFGLVPKAMILGLAALIAPLAAQAATVNATLLSVSPYRSVEVSTNWGSNYGGVTAGELDWSRTGGEGSSWLGPKYSTFCIEINEHVSYNNNYTYMLGALAAGPTSMSGGMGSGKADLIAELYGRFLPGLTQDDSDYAAAFQMSVWELVMDNDRNLGTGVFRARNNGSYFGLAQSMLGALNGAGPRANITALLANGVQDQIVVPEPASLAFLAVGLLGWFRRR